MCFNTHTEKLIQIKLKEILNKFIDSSDRKKGFYEGFLLSKKKKKMILRYLWFQCLVVLRF